MKPAALHTLMQWLSPGYPVGAFAYSHGLEFAISEGQVSDLSSLKHWLLDILHFGSGRNDAILLVQAYRAKNPAELATIAETATAFAASAERRDETVLQGAAFIRTTNAIWPDTLPNMPYPVAIGAAAHRHALPVQDTTTLYLHAFTANLISAAVRFMPLGQTDGQRLLAELSPAFETITTQALAATLDDLGGCAWLADMAAMHHETMTTRIFRT